MLKHIFFLFLLSSSFIWIQAQPGGGMQNGHFYGKIIDATTGKAIDAASVQLVTDRRNTAVVSSRDSIVSGQLTQSNGDFSLENVGLIGNYRLLVTAIGYKTVELPVSFFTAEQQQKLAAAIRNRQGGTSAVAVPDSNRTNPVQSGTIPMTPDSLRPSTNAVSDPGNTIPAADSADRSRTDSAVLPTQHLTTLSDSAQFRANPRPDGVRPADSTNRQPAVNAVPGTTSSGRNGALAGAGRNGIMEAFRQVFGNDMSFLAAQADKDLGNIRLQTDVAALGNVTVTASQPVYTLGIDRKIFNVDRALTSQGQSAVEVLRQVPSVNVDIDGNVTLRNTAPTLFVDGRPTTLTLDQIPADAIQSIEVITNPSAKFDASGGTASILNVVMKKNRKSGYNGSVRAGADSRGRFNAGGDINLRQQKMNLFLSGQYSQRKSKAWTDILTRYNATGSLAAYHLTQNSYSENTGGFGFLRGGFDYFMDNRNTLTVAGSFNRGSFGNDEDGNLRYDTFINPVLTGYGTRNTNSDGYFRNWGGTASYKHTFAKSGHELTADVNLNSSNSENEANVNNLFYNQAYQPKSNPALTLTQGQTKSTLWVIQSDYANPLSDKAKIEAGVRAQIRNFNSTNLIDTFNYASNRYLTNDSINSRYNYTDQVFAAYVTYTGKAGNLGYNFGLRAESSNYDGTQYRFSTKTDSAFRVNFPISLFPSAFLSYKIGDKQDLQFNYTRRINRPSFFQLIPFTDYTDQQNLSQGNAGLRPEFTNSLEANYNYQFNNGNNILASIYYRNTNNLITRYFDKVYNPNIEQEVNRGTFVNANSSNSYGLELTSRNTIKRVWDITSNLNLYNATINGSNIGTSGTTNSRFSYFAKLNTNYKLGKNTSWTVQANADYQGKSVLPAGGGGGGGRGGRGGGGGSFFGNSNQAAGTNGYVNPFGGLDLAIKKDFLKNKAASITISMQDVLRTRRRSTYILTDFYTQDFSSRRDQQVVRLQFNWRFGRQDVNLFKRRNNRGEDGSSEGMQGLSGQ